jgi:hypothetical protein
MIQLVREKNVTEEKDKDFYFLEVLRNGKMNLYFFGDGEELRELRKIIDRKIPVSRERYAANMENMLFSIKKYVRVWIDRRVKDDMMQNVSRVKYAFEIFDLYLVNTIANELKEFLRLDEGTAYRIKEDIVLYLMYRSFKSYGTIYF